MADFPYKTRGHLGTIVPGVGWNGTPKDGAGSSSTTWPTANRAIYIPFTIEVPVVVTAIGVLVGLTSSGNIDVGIYTFDGVRLVSSGSTAQATASTLQTFDITDTQLGPGSFYLGVAMDNATGTIWRIGILARRLQVLGFMQQAAAFPLPATAAFATMTSANIPVSSLLLSPRTAF